MAARWEFGALMGLWQYVGGSYDTAPLAAAVALAESGGDPNAHGGADDRGLWQIVPRFHPQYDAARLYEPAYNARAAVAISGNGSSWQAWCTAYSDGACGHRGGYYDPTGDSPSGGYYRAHPGAYVHRTPVAGTRAGPPPGLQGPLGVPEPVSMLAAWAQLVNELSTTLPTQMKRIEHISRVLAPAARHRRRDARPPGLIGPIGG